MNIERLTENDLLPLSELFGQFWGEDTSLDRMRATYTKLATNPAYIFLAAKKRGRLVGFVMGIICEELYGDGRSFMVIEDLIVDKNRRRSGIGAALMREAEKCALDHDCCQIIFITESDRTEALEFYRTLGYEFEPYKGFKRRIGSNQSENSADARNRAADSFVKLTMKISNPYSIYVQATEKSQIERLAGLAREIWSDHFGPMIEKEMLDAIIEKVQSADAIEKQIAEGYLYYFIQPQGTPVGYFAYRINTTEDVLFLSKLYLLSARRRQGFGRQVMQHLEEICRIRHLSRLRLTVFHKNTSAMKVYERYGFHHLGPIRRDLGNGMIIHDYEMEKTIQPVAP